VTWSRRELLATLGVASANAVLFACSGAPRRVAHATEISPEVRTWLHEALAIMTAAGLDRAHVLAVASRRTTAAIDVLGAGVARNRCEGVVLSARDKTGIAREQMTNDLSRDGVLAAVRLLLGVERSAKLRSASIDIGPAPAAIERVVPDPESLSDGELLGRVGGIAKRDKDLSSRIVYASNVLDIDDAHVWSIAPGRSLEQRLVRVRRAVSRVAWHGTRPFVGEAARAWTGGVDAQDLTDDEIIGARDNALALLTPTPFEDNEYAIVLEPAVGAALLDAAVRTLLTSDAQRRSDVARRIAARGRLSEKLTLVDDPTVRDAYGTYRFDDTGVPAAARTLVDAGRLVGRVERASRAGHLGRVEITPAHVRVAAGSDAAATLLDHGMLLEGHQSTLVDPSSDRFVIQVARAREYVGGRSTGRAFADIELTGELTALLGGLTGVSRESRSIGMRDEVDGLVHHRSYDTPWVAGTAQLRQRRRAT
jgi:predicted Zn-dependent protease